MNAVVRYPRSVLALLVGVAVVGCGSSDDSSGEGPEEATYEPVEYEPDALGPYRVGYVSTIAVDPSRADRSLALDIWYPVDEADAAGAEVAEYILQDPIGLESEVALAEPPVSARSGQTLLVFSHGYESIRAQSFGLMETLASHGFIVASPEHTGNAQPTPGDPFDIAAANRVPDVSFVIDWMLERSADSADAFADRLDPENVGVVGNSFGAMTSIGMASGWAGAPPDPRVKAIAPISAVVDGDLQQDTRDTPNAGFTAEQLASIEVPVLLIGGTLDVNVPIENNQIAFDGLTQAPAVYKVDIEGATHTHFAAICPLAELLIGLGLGPESWPGLGAEDLVEPYETTCSEEAFPFAETTRLQNLYVVSFFRLHMLGEADYGQFFTQTHAATEAAVTLTVK